MPAGVYVRGLAIGQRYLGHIDRSDPESCWPWTGYIGNHGYGVVCGRLAHRVGWELRHEVELPAALWVLHHCDYRPCQNPDHWFVGTHADNMVDMAIKRRRRDVASWSRLTPATHEEMFTLRARGFTLAQIGEATGFTGQHVGRLLCQRAL